MKFSGKITIKIRVYVFLIRLIHRIFKNYRCIVNIRTKGELVIDTDMNRNMYIGGCTSIEE